MPGYDDIISQMKADQSATGTQPANPYDDAVGALRAQDQSDRARAALAVGLASNANADVAARNAQLAKRYNTTPDVVAAYPQDFRDRMALEMAKEQLANAPKLTNYINTTPGGADMAHPDVPHLANLEQTAQHDWKDTLGQTALAVPQGMGLVMNKAATSLNELIGLPMRGVDALAGTDTYGSWRRAMIDPLLRDRQYLVPDANAPFLPKAAHAAASTLETMVLAALTGGAGETTQLANAGASTADVVGAQVMHGMRSMLVPAASDAIDIGREVYDQTGDKAAALKATMAQFAASEMMGVVPMSAPGGLVQRTATGLGVGTVMGELTRQHMNANLPADMQTPWSGEEAIISGLTGGVFGAFGPRALHPYASEQVRQTYRDAARMESIERDAQQLTTMSQLAQTIKLRETNPEEFKRAAQLLTEDGHLENIYVDAGVFAQALDKAGVTMDELAAKVPDVADQLREAQTLGVGDIKIATSDYLTHMAGSKLDQDILQNFKAEPGPDSATLKEATEYWQGHNEKMQAAADNVIKSLKQSDEFNASAAEVAKTIQDDLKATGRGFGQEKTQAAITTAIIAKQAAREGITPKEAWEKYGQDIRSRVAAVGGETAGQVRNIALERDAAQQAFEQRKPSSDVGHKRESNGRYVGAPDWVGNSPQKLAGVRKNLDKLTLEGTAGRYWYENSARAVLELTGGDKADAEKFIGLLAIYSPGTGVAPNTTAALKAWYQWKAGEPITAGRFPGTMGKKAEAWLNRGEDWGGIKTNNFYTDLMEEIDPSKVDTHHSTMDMWMALAGDYGSKVLDQGPKYEFMQREIKRIADTTGWRPHQVQAAIWTAIRARVMGSEAARQEFEKKQGILVPHESGFEVAKGREYDHFRAATKYGLEAPMSQEDIDKTYYDFGTALRQRSAQISWEATPGASTGVLPGIHNAPMHQQIEYLHAIRRALRDESGRDLIDKQLGLLTSYGMEGYSGWQGKPSVGVQQKAGVQVENGVVTGHSRRRIGLAADIRGMLLAQEGMAWHFPIFDGAKYGHNGTEIDLGRSLTEAENEAIYAALARELGHTYAPPIPTESGFRVLNFPDEKFALMGEKDKAKIKELQKASKQKNDAFHDAVVRAIESLPDIHKEVKDVARFETDGELRENNWSNGDADYRSRIAAESARDDAPRGPRGQDLLEWVDDDLRPRIEAVQHDFAERYGWDQPGGGFYQAERGGSATSKPDGAENGRGPGEHAFSGTGVHFSREVRSALHGNYFGTGLKGLELERLKEATDPRIRERVYFYVDEGKGIRPEAGVGGYAHEVSLNNLYNVKGDPLKLFKAGDLNASESRVLDAGYDGYYFPNYGSGQGIAIVLGDATRGMRAEHVNYTGAQPLAAAPEGPYRRGLMSNEIEKLDMSKVNEAAPSAKVRAGTFQVDRAELEIARKVLADQGIDLPVDALQHGDEDVVRGSYNPEGRLVSMFKDANLSTYLHETGHWALDIYSKIAASDKAPPEVRDDMGKILQWFGIDSLEKWNSMSIDEQRPYHEQFARSFEAYLMEGKAPTQELQPFFSRIKEWMKQIYGTLNTLNVPLTDEVRGVFDRMLASEEAIAEAERARNLGLPNERPSYISEADWAALKKMQGETHEQAVDELTAQKVRNMKWERGARSKALRVLQAQAKEARAGIEAEVTKEVDKMPIYRAERWLRKGEMTTESGEEIKVSDEGKKGAKLNTEMVKALFPEENLSTPQLEKLRGMTGPHGMDPELAAEMFGFDSGEQLVRQLVDLEPRKTVIEGMTDKRMIEEHDTLATPEGMQAAADRILANETHGRFAATVLKVLAKAPTSAGALFRGAEEAARGIIADKRVGDVNPRQYLAAENKANKEMLNRAAKDTPGAVAAQRAVLLANRLTNAAYDALDDVRKAVAYAKSFDKRAKRLKIDPEERDLIDGLLSRFDFRQNPGQGFGGQYISAESSKQQVQLTQWVNSQKALGYTPVEVADMMNPEVRMHYKDMTVGQLRGLMDTIKSIEKIGRERQRVTIEGKSMEIAEALAPMLDKMKERGEKFTDAQLAERPRYGVDPLWTVTLDRVGSWLRAGFSELVRPDFKANKYDLHELLGPMSRGIFERMFKAAYDYGDYLDGIGQLKRERVAQYGLDKDWQKTLTDVVTNHNLMDNSLEEPSKRRLTRSDLIGIAMHVGNESNFDKLVRGMDWKPEDIWQALHDNMTEKDWRAAQTMGELAGARWDDMVAMNRRLGNDTPSKIEPRPFPTKFGDMPGWYAPVDYDPLRSKLGAKKAEASAVNPADGLFSRDYFRADTTTNGSLNARASGYYDFVDLNWRPMEKRISDTMRDLAYREALIDIHKIYSNKEFRRQFQRTYGPEEYKHFGDWLGRMVNSEVGDEKQSKFIAAVAASRRAIVANGVAFRISTILKHGGSAGAKSAGYFAGGGEKFFGQRIASMATNYMGEVNEALAKFPEIRQRLRQQDRDYGIAVQSMFEPESIHGKAERFGHAGVAWLDFLTAVPTANAAYDWATTTGIPKRLGGTGEPMSHDDAVKFASKVVREAHSSTNEASQSLLINSRSEAVKTLTTLGGFMNNALGQNADMFDKLTHSREFGRPEIFARFFMGQVVPAIMAGYVSFGGPNEDETWLGWAFHHIAGEYAGMLPMVREGWSVAAEGFDKAGLPPWMHALQDIGKAVKSIGKEATGEEAKHPIKDVGNAAGLLLPGLGQAGATTQFLYDVKTGQQEPETVGEWLRGIMSGTAKRHE